jgi:hypothetical protein
MPITHNGTNITAVTFNGTTITTVVFNGTTVFTAVQWVFVDSYSSDPFADLTYEGDGSGGNITGMINTLNTEYPPGDYEGLTVSYYAFDDDLYYLFSAD